MYYFYPQVVCSVFMSKNIIFCIFVLVIFDDGND